MMRVSPENSEKPKVKKSKAQADAANFAFRDGVNPIFTPMKMGR
jgi:hypothetical protein